MSSKTAYRADEPSRVRAHESSLREQLIDEGLLRPRRYEDGLWPIQLAPATVVFRQFVRREVLA